MTPELHRKMAEFLSSKNGRYLVTQMIAFFDARTDEESMEFASGLRKAWDDFLTAHNLEKEDNGQAKDN